MIPIPALRALRALAAASFLITSVSSPGADNADTGDIERWLSLKEPAYMTPITISADGKWLAVTMKGQVSEGAAGRGLPREAGMFETAAEDLAGCEVLIVERATGKVLHPFRKYAGSYSPAWAPTGGTLALAVQDSPTRFPRVATWSPGDDSPRVFADAAFHPTIGFTAPAWTPDSRRIVFMCYNVTPSKPPRIIGKIIPEKRDADDSGESKEKLAVLDTGSGGVRTFGGPGPYGYSRVWGFRISPDGKSAAFLSRATPIRQEADANWVKLAVVNLETGALEVIGDTPQMEGWGMSHSWSPDGRHIAWLPVAGKENKLIIATPGEKAPLREVALPKESRGGRLVPADDWPPAPPLWAVDSSSFWIPGKDALLHFSVDGSALGTLALNSGMGGIDWLESSVPSFAPVRTQAVPASGEIHILRKRGIETVNVLSAAPVPPVIAVSAGKERAVDPATSTIFSLKGTGVRGWELVQTSCVTGKTERLALLHPGLTDIQMGTTRTLTWKMPGGENCGGTLLLPPGWKDGDKPPVVMDVYGGEKGNGNKTPGAMADACNIINPHILAARGYAFFKPDMPQAGAEPAASLARAAEAAVEALTASGLVDTGRVAITGQSYGGYTALAALVASRKFKAGIVANGIYDLTREDTDANPHAAAWVEEDQGLMKGSLWDNPRRYIDNSPLFALNKLQTPLLVLQGESDEISKDQGPSLQGALRRLGKPSIYLLATEMDHVPVAWSVETQRDLIPRILAFLDEHLRSGESGPAPQAKH